METLASLFSIAVTYAIINNVVLSQFLGICPFLGVSKKTETASGMGLAVIFVITIAAFVTGVINKFILANEALINMGIDLRYLKTIVFILVIASLVQFVEMFLKKSAPALYQALGVFLPLITTNCAVLGVAVTNMQKGYNFIESVLNAVGGAAGFALAIVLFAGIRGRIADNDTPKAFDGFPMALITAGLMSIAIVLFRESKVDKYGAIITLTKHYICRLNIEVHYTLLVDIADGRSDDADIFHSLLLF